MTSKIKGNCLCGAVEFETSLPGHIDACHCKTCRSWNGGPFIGADFREGITFIKDEGLVWYESSEWAKRGFCKTCGSSLFYRLKSDPNFWSIAAGTLDLPEGLTLGKEIFIDEKPDYYNLAGEQKRLTGAEAFAEFTSGENNE
jgi:hypothetical protein